MDVTAAPEWPGAGSSRACTPTPLPVTWTRSPVGSGYTRGWVGAAGAVACAGRVATATTARGTAASAPTSQRRPTMSAPFVRRLQTQKLGPRFDLRQWRAGLQQYSEQHGEAGLDERGAGGQLDGADP